MTSAFISFWFKTHVALALPWALQLQDHFPITYTSSRIDLIERLHSSFVGAKFERSLLSELGLLPHLSPQQRTHFGYPSVTLQTSRRPSGKHLWSANDAPALSFVTLTILQNVFQDLSQQRTVKGRRGVSTEEANVLPPKLIIIDEPQISLPVS